MWLICTVVLGAIAGFLAGRIIKGRGTGADADLGAGIVGSVLGGIVFALLGLATYGLIERRLMSVVGDVILMIVHVIEHI
jgi:uncharacterized membrane protein YeaQ/YmgE (transglycosylase-associated protein family)